MDCIEYAHIIHVSSFIRRLPALTFTHIACILLFERNSYVLYMTQVTLCEAE